MYEQSIQSLLVKQYDSKVKECYLAKFQIQLYSILA